MSRRRAPTDDQLKRLKALRLEQGLSLDTVAERTGLPVAHVQALEEARVEELPAGPYVGAYYRLVRGVLGGADDLEAQALPEPPPQPRVPLWAVRTLALLSVAALIGLFGWQVGSGQLDLWGLASDEIVAGPAETGPDQVVSLTAVTEARFRVIVDGEVAFDGRLPAGARRRFEGRDRIEVEVAAAEDARIVYNGQAIRPQGRQGRPRRLVFLDDVSPDG